MDEVKKVEILDLDGKKYKRIQTPEGEFWCLETIAYHTNVPYKTITNHLYKKKKIFAPFIKKFLKSKKNSVGRRRLFLKVPEALDQLRLYVRALKNNTEMNRIMEHISKVRTGEHRIITQDDVTKLQNQVLTQVTENITAVLKGNPLLQKFSTMFVQIQETQKKLDQQIEYLKGEQKFTSQHTYIIQNLIRTYAVKYKLSGRQVWLEFAEEFGISGYRNAERKYFTAFVEYFFELDPRVVASVFNRYVKKSYKDTEIIETVLSILQGKSKTLVNLGDYT
ncbi:hypothetical protein [Candidatus Borrarchaeum sp.]|uniref:hypothetical protein n=1 Tax=Candidatus Borrarchaeum sp. TaxID=2846742 RepID=UPI002580867A|nr:hypothetical protein [Candidatus Borrarchaeum sp.]